MPGKSIIVSIMLLFFAVVNLCQSSKPIPAKEIMNSAFKEAKSADKNVFLIFHASWCSWCKRLEKVLETPSVKQIMEDNYIITRLDVLERDDKIAELENSGGKEIMKNLGGENSGLPFYVFLDAQGKKLANSNVMLNDMNIGFPGSPEELDAFKTLLKNTSKKINDEQLNLIIETIKKNLPPPKIQN